MASKIEMEIEMKSSSEKVWKNLKEFATVLPKALPNIYERIDVIEGDGKSVGSIVASTFKPSQFKPIASTLKERIDIMDEERKIMKYSYIEGDILKNYKSFNTTFFVSSNKSGGTLINLKRQMQRSQIPNEIIYCISVSYLLLY